MIERKLFQDNLRKGQLRESKTKSFSLVQTFLRYCLFESDSTIYIHNLHKNVVQGSYTTDSKRRLNMLFKEKLSS